MNIQIEWKGIKGSSCWKVVKKNEKPNVFHATNQTEFNYQSFYVIFWLLTRPLLKINRCVSSTPFAGFVVFYPTIQNIKKTFSVPT